MTRRVRATVAALALAPALSGAPLPLHAQLATPALPRADFFLDGTARQGSVLIGRAPSGAVSVSLDGIAVPTTPEGFFIVGFDRDHDADANFVARLADGRVVQRLIAVAPAQWRIEHVNAPPRGGAANNADFAARRGVELARINAARSVDHVSNGWRQAFRWPVAGRQSGWFGAQRVYQGQPGSYHSGADIAAPTGTVFTAPADGVVTLAAREPFTLEGHLLMIDHGMGLNSAFLHASELLVREGDVVKQGQPIGKVGATGRASGPHLHWGMKWRSARIDPAALAGGLPPKR